MRAGICVLLVLTMAGATARAQDQAPGALDFDLFGDQKAIRVDPAQAKRQADFDRRVDLRRRMLKAHQAFGFITLAVMAATLVIGQLDYLDQFGREGVYTQRYRYPHLGLASATAATFTTTGLLALFAPNPYPKPIKADAALAHKLMMGLATAGMVTQLILGPIIAAHEGKLDQRDLATGHLVVGYATWAFMASGVLAYVF